jgi:hypothetical protein
VREEQDATLPAQKHVETNRLCPISAIIGRTVEANNTVIEVPCAEPFRAGLSHRARSACDRDTVEIGERVPSIVVVCRSQIHANRFARKRIWRLCSPICLDQLG